jgi:glutamate-ammonia-ligase adenylyltransferase
MVEDQQTHTLPSDAAQLGILARRMPIEAGGDTLTAETMRSRLAGHAASVREIYERVIHAQRPLVETLAEPLPDVEPEPASSVTRVIEDRAPQLAGAVTAANLQRGKERFQHFLEKAIDSPAVLQRLESDSRLAASVLDIFEHSSYFADELLRHPELINEIGERFQLEGGALSGSAALRRSYRRQMLRIQCESILSAEPIFHTLSKTSILADSVIAAAYEMAVRDSRPSSPDYVPQDQMMVIALGRLGMREFDLGSDADLVFVIPDQDAAELGFWTMVAERMIEAISSYTSEGVMFAIDTRLRPNGREGGLVQPVSAYRTYFEQHAEAWEGISYMKARSVAGNLEASTEFLQTVQALDWRRYGQSMRSRKELALMRARLEREQGTRNPLKAGAGGYYDIDFALMFLRLKGAGIFYKVLNTPERIDVIEKMGHLDREEADFLNQAATFYRAIDHGQRISIGHAAGSLPSSEAQLEVLASLVRRWAPENLKDHPLQAALQDVRRQTREFFNRLFGRP